MVMLIIDILPVTLHWAPLWLRTGTHPDKGRLLVALLQEWNNFVDQQDLFAQIQSDTANWEAYVSTLRMAL